MITNKQFKNMTQVSSVLLYRKHKLVFDLMAWARNRSPWMSLFREVFKQENYGSTPQYLFALAAFTRYRDKIIRRRIRARNKKSLK